MLDRIVGLLPPGWKPASSPTVDYLYSVIVGGTGRGGTRRFHIVHSDAAMIARTSDLQEALRRLEVDLRLYVAERSLLGRSGFGTDTDIKRLKGPDIRTIHQFRHCIKKVRA